MLAAACSGSRDSVAHTTPPTRAGDVWEVDSAANRTYAAGAMLAFTHGLHVFVMDGDDIYAGMKKLHLEPSPQGGRSVDLGNGESARLVPVGDAYEMHFAGGDSVLIHKQDRTGGNS